MSIRNSLSSILFLRFFFQPKLIRWLIHNSFFLPSVAYSFDSLNSFIHHYTFPSDGSGAYFFSQFIISWIYYAIMLRTAVGFRISRVSVTHLWTPLDLLSWRRMNEIEFWCCWFDFASNSRFIYRLSRILSLLVFENY